MPLQGTGTARGPAPAASALPAIVPLATPQPVPTRPPVLTPGQQTPVARPPGGPLQGFQTPSPSTSTAHSAMPPPAQALSVVSPTAKQQQPVGVGPVGSAGAAVRPLGQTMVNTVPRSLPGQQVGAKRPAGPPYAGLPTASCDVFDSNSTCATYVLCGSIIVPGLEDAMGTMEIPDGRAKRIQV